MTQDEIYEMAHQAGVENEFNYDFRLSLETFAALVAAKAAAKEREDVIQHLLKLKVLSEDGAFTAEIRARGEA